MPKTALHPQPDRALVAPSRRLAQHGTRAGTPSLAVLGRMTACAAMIIGTGLAAWTALPGARSGWEAAQAGPPARLAAAERSAAPPAKRLASAAP